uniref:Uncharacterized protein n=1 Tax=Mesocestoides corti TaxID=53468 RepID=A0A5K3FJV9_MESCO
MLFVEDSSEMVRVLVSRNPIKSPPSYLIELLPDTLPPADEFNPVYSSVPRPRKSNRLKGQQHEPLGLYSTIKERTVSYSASR